MKVKNAKTYYYKTRTITKDGEGTETENWGEPEEIRAYIYPASGKVQAEIYGQRLAYILNMLYDGPAEISEMNGICVDVDSSASPDYRIISIKQYTGHKLVELERIR